MKLIVAALALALPLAAVAQQGYVHGNGDPRVITPMPNCGQSRFYIDDTTGQMYTSAQGSPCVWTLGGGTTTNPLTVNNSGAGAASGSTFDGSAPKTISYNSVGAAPALAWPFPPQAIYFAFNGVFGVNSIPDTSGNGNNAAFGAGSAAPAWISSTTLYQALKFSPTTAQDQWATVPNAVTCGGKTFLFYYTPLQANPADANGQQYLLSDAGFNSFFIPNVAQGEAAYGGATSQSTDPVGNNVGVAYAMGSGTIYPYGIQATGLFPAAAPNMVMNCAGAIGYLGHIAGATTSNSGFAGTFHGLVIFSQLLTSPQIAQAYAYGAAQIKAAGGPDFTVKPANNTRILYGPDSRSANFGMKFALQTSRPFYIAQADPTLAPFLDIGVNGQTLNTYGVSKLGLAQMQASVNPNRLILFDGIYNDIVTAACANAAACFTTVQTAGTNYTQPGISTVYATPLPGTSMSSGNETTREGVLASVLSAATATPSTFNWTGVDDIADDPIAATQTLPNSYLPAASALTVSTGSYSSPNASITFTTAVPVKYCYPGALFNMVVTGVGQYSGSKILASCSGSTITFAATNCVCTPSAGTGTFISNGLFYIDGLHYSAAFNKELSTQEAFSVKAASGLATPCTVIQKTIPYQVPQIANDATPGLTLTMPLLQLFPGWQLCSLSMSTVTTSPVPGGTAGVPFTGSTTLTLSIGDSGSGGSATSYLPAQNLMTATETAASAFTPFRSNSGIVQLNFTATGANLNALTAGNVNVSIGVQVRP